jgi:lysophospholipase L1-like esterase
LRLPRITTGRTRLIAPVALAAAFVAGPAYAAAKPSYYVSLGDSLARGYQPRSDGRNVATGNGYVDVVAAGLARSHPGLRSVKLGCGGETTYSIAAGGRCSYREGSQLAAAEAFLKAHRSRVVAVSVNVGDNDVERCVRASGIDTGCVNAQMAALKKRLPRVASRLHAAAGKNTPIVGLSDYDQFMAYWLRGASGRRVARRSVGIVGDLNETMDTIYASNGVRVADARPDFATDDLSHYVKLSGHGRVPRAVARICRWTWACSGPPIGFNDHANTTGYRVLGRIVLGVIGPT